MQQQHFAVPLASLSVLLVCCFSLSLLLSSGPASGSTSEIPETEGISLRAKMQASDLDRLIRQAHSKDKVTQLRAIGRLLKHLKPGMSRKEVEAWIGPPARTVDGGITDEEGTLVGEYGCHLEDGWQEDEGIWMSVHYQKVGLTWRFYKIRGPHSIVD